MKVKKLLVACLGLVLPPLLSACSAGPAPRPVAEISHVVFVSLADPSRTPALLADADASLATIPGVVSFAAGPHIDTGRPGVLHDYDAGMIIGFDSEADYAVYVTHPNHTAFVDRWKPAVTSLRIYDIHDPMR